MRDICKGSLSLRSCLAAFQGREMIHGQRDRGMAGTAGPLFSGTTFANVHRGELIGRIESAMCKTDRPGATHFSAL